MSEHVDAVEVRLKYTDMSEQDGLAIKVRLYRKRAIKPTYSRLHTLRKQERANAYRANKLIRHKRAFAAFEVARVTE